MAARKCSLGRIGKYWLNISISFLLSEQLVLLNELSKKCWVVLKRYRLKAGKQTVLHKTAFPRQQALKSSPFLAVLFMALALKSFWHTGLWLLGLYCWPLLVFLHRRAAVNKEKTPRAGEGLSIVWCGAEPDSSLKFTSFLVVWYCLSTGLQWVVEDLPILFQPGLFCFWDHFALAFLWVELSHNRSCWSACLEGKDFFVPKTSTPFQETHYVLGQSQ